MLSRFPCGFPSLLKPPLCHNEAMGIQDTRVERIGVIGDIHACDLLLEAAVGLLKAEGLPIFSTGDVVDGAGDVHKCIALLIEQGVKVVRGNHDEWLIKNIMRDSPQDSLKITQPGELSEKELAYVNALPATITIETTIGSVLLCHGVGHNNMNKINPDDYGYAIEVNDDLQKLIVERKYEAVINGHSHKKMMRDFNGLVVINAGSLVGQPGFLVVDFKKREVEFHIFEGSVSKKEKVASF
jgi:predicted phosphodiesterase